MWPPPFQYAQQPQQSQQPQQPQQQHLPPPSQQPPPHHFSQHPTLHNRPEHHEQFPHHLTQYQQYQQQQHIQQRSLEAQQASHQLHQRALAQNEYQYQHQPSHEHELQHHVSYGDQQSHQLQRSFEQQHPSYEQQWCFYEQQQQQQQQQQQRYHGPQRQSSFESLSHSALQTQASLSLESQQLSFEQHLPHSLSSFDDVLRAHQLAFDPDELSSSFDSQPAHRPSLPQHAQLEPPTQPVFDSQLPAAASSYLRQSQSQTVESPQLQRPRLDVSPRLLPLQHQPELRQPPTVQRPPDFKLHDELKPHPAHRQEQDIFNRSEPRQQQEMSRQDKVPAQQSQPPHPTLQQAMSFGPSSWVLESPDPLNLIDSSTPTVASGYHPSAFYSDPAATGSPKVSKKRKGETVQAQGPADKQPPKKQKKQKNSISGRAQSGASPVKDSAERAPVRSSESVIEVVIPISSSSSSSKPATSRLPSSKPKAAVKANNGSAASRASKAPPTTPTSSIYVEIPPASHGSMSHKNGNGVKKRPAWDSAAVAEIVIDSESDQDAEGSDWDDPDLLETWSTPKSFLGGSNYATPLGALRVSNGPVKGSTRKVPMAKLRGLIEDLFEADDSLPDADEVRSMSPAQPFFGPAEQFFEVIQSPSASAASHHTVVALRLEVVQKLLKFVRQCSRPLHEMSGPARTTASGKPMDLASLPLQDLGRLCNILERLVRLSENLDPFPAQHKVSTSAKAYATKKSKKKPKGKAEGSPAIVTPPPPEQPNEAQDEEVEARDEKNDAPSAAEAEEDDLEDLNRKLAAAVRCTLAAECCLAVLAADTMPKPLLSEDLIRSCFEAIKTSLDKVLLPFIEGCANEAQARSQPALAALIHALAPQKARKKKNQPRSDEQTGGIAVVCRDTLSRLFRHTCSALYVVQRLVRIPSVSLSDSVVISGVYFSLGPFFVQEPDATTGGSGSGEAAKATAAGRAAMASLGGPNVTKCLRLPALNLLRDIFAQHPDQRQWIIEEILTSLTKLTDMKKNRRHYSLRNGKSMHAVNALLLQLIQAATHSLPQQVKSAVTAIRTSRRRRRTQREGDDDAEQDDERDEYTARADADGEGDEADMEEEIVVEMDAWRKGLEGAHQSAKAIVYYLLQRAGQSKVARSSQESSHALIIDNLVQDLLNVLYLPDWPAAALLLSNFCRLFGACLEDPKGNPDTKGVALDHLGTIAAHIRRSHLLSLGKSASMTTMKTAAKNDPRRSESPSTPPAHDSEASHPVADEMSVASAIKNLDMDVVERITTSYRSLFVYLARSDNDVEAVEGAMEFLMAQLQGELATAHVKVRSRLDNAIEKDSPSLEIARIHRFGKFLEDTVEKVGAWSISDAELTAPIEEDKFEEALVLSERLTISSSIMVSYDFMHAQLVEALDGQSVSNRSKALRGLGSISSVDPDLLDTESVRSAVEIRLRDSSTIVRETAVGLLGRYVLRKPAHIERYYDQLAGRIHDAGLAVRKRVLRLLKTFHFAATSQRIRTDSCARIVRCVNDEDKIVQELAIATIGEMWLPIHGFPQDSGRVRLPSEEDDAGFKSSHVDASNNREGTISGDSELSQTIDTIMAVAEVIRERPSPLEEVFRRLLKDRREPEATELLKRLQQLSDAMIDTLVESSEGTPRDVVNRVKTVQLLVSTNPSILSIAKAKLLLPYLKAAQTQEEVQIMELLLKIFRACLPWMPKTALAFAEALEKSLTPLVSRPPPAAQMSTMQELIACFCTVIVSHTHNFKILARTLRACFSRLQQIRVAVAGGKRVEEFPSWNKLTSLTALLCEHADFDQIRVKHAEVATDIDAISTKPIVDVVSETLLDIYKLSSGPVRSFFLQNLGFLFRAYPSLMTRPTITRVMDDIFESGSFQDRAMLLRIILEFLDADSARRDPEAAVAPTPAKKAADGEGSDGVDMTVLVGNTESFADTGVGSAMMQRYSDPVLRATLEVEHPVLQRSATEILKFTVMQGLSHPIQCVPYLVALETTDDGAIRAKALQLHSHLASKHASLVQARFLDSAKIAFRFRLKQATPQTVRGHRSDGEPSAMLNPWYSLLRDRRNTRLDFLKQIVKALDVNTAASECDVDGVLFARFIADNLATLDYKTLEELFIVIGELRAILAVSGMQVLFMVQSTLKKVLPAGPVLQAAPAPSADAETTAVAAASDGPSSSPEPPQHAPQSPAMPASSTESNRTGQSATSTPELAVLARMSIISGTALLLRNHLKTLYNLAEARCAKFNPAKKQSAGADRPATRRTLHDSSLAALTFDSMPLGLSLIDAEADAVRQLETYASMIEHEGTMLEPEDPEMMEELAP